MKLRLIEKRHETSDITTFVFESDQEITRQAGQYLRYILPNDAADERGFKRWFTCSASPTEPGVWITTRLVDKRSSFKTALDQLAAGDEVEATDPEGDFLLPQSTERPLVFVAGGIGVTPYRSMLVYVRDKGLKYNIRLLYAARSEQDIAFKPLFDELASSGVCEVVYHTEDTQGRLDAAGIIEAAKDLSKPVYYLSGPEPMVEAFEAAMKEAGVAEDDIKGDYFPGYEATL
jgi:ferredoxin-NADP reductase